MVLNIKLKDYGKLNSFAKQMGFASVDDYLQRWLEQHAGDLVTDDYDAYISRDTDTKVYLMELLANE